MVLVPYEGRCFGGVVDSRIRAPFLKDGVIGQGHIAHRIPLSRPSVGLEEKAGVPRVLDSGMLAQGAEVAALEAEFADLLGVEHAIATSSGTAALHLALLAHGVGPGDEVITSRFTCIDSANRNL